MEVKKLQDNAPNLKNRVYIVEMRPGKNFKSMAEHTDHSLKKTSLSALEQSENNTEKPQSSFQYFKQQ